MTIDVYTEWLDDENVAADELDLSVDRTDSGWRPYLGLKPEGTGVMTFGRCAQARPN